MSAAFKRAKAARYAQRRRDLVKAGRWEPMLTPADDAIAHLQRLAADGWLLPCIEAWSDINRAYLARLIRERHPITRAVEGRILNASPDYDVLPDGVLVPKIGLLRRSNALAAIGWSKTAQGERLGTVRRLIAAVRPHVAIETWRQMRDLYDELSMTPGPYPTRMARHYDWPPPLAWDDDTIDDPATQPHLYGRELNDPRAGLKRLHLEDIEWILADQPMATTEHLALRLHVSKDAIQAACRRAGRDDLTRQLARNARQESVA